MRLRQMVQELQIGGTSTDRAESSVAALLLAAGASRRFGSANKLLAEVDGVALVRLAAQAILAARIQSLVVVTGHDRAQVEAALSGLALTTVHAEDHPQGLAASLRCGVRAVPPSVAGAAICLADMPGLTAALIDRLVDAFEAERGMKIVYPQSPDGRQGHPVIWPRRFFVDLTRLEGDRGAKALLAVHADSAVAISVEDDAAFADIDTPDDLKRWPSET